MNIPFKNIPLKTSSNDSDLKELLEELNKLIPKFVTSSIYKRDIFEGSDENHYTETLIKYFEAENINSRFSYKQQTSLPNRRSMDIGVHLKANSEHYIFNIEAKFLPPKDYVTGEYAAIKRFKSNQHGLSNRNPEKCKLLLQSAILAYDKTDEFEKHLKKINSIIEKLAKNSVDKFGLNWTKSEQLEKVYINSTAQLKSNHLRIDNSSILLHHYWVNV